jgi:hypothetical protein
MMTYSSWPASFKKASSSVTSPTAPWAPCPDPLLGSVFVSRPLPSWSWSQKSRPSSCLRCGGRASLLRSCCRPLWPGVPWTCWTSCSLTRLSRGSRSYLAQGWVILAGAGELVLVCDNLRVVVVSFFPSCFDVEVQARLGRMTQRMTQRKAKKSKELIRQQNLTTVIMG